MFGWAARLDVLGSPILVVFINKQERVVDFAFDLVRKVNRYGDSSLLREVLREIGMLDVAWVLPA